MPCHQCHAELREGDRFCAACGTPVIESGAEQDPLVGRTIGGGYVIRELVGTGGMGRVYRAEQTALGRTVAIKIVHPHLLADESSVARFYTEARAASSLNHPSTVSIIDFGRTDDGILYLVMEFLQGRDLARLMNEDGPLPIARICEIVGAVLETLHEAHELQVVHRDLKPENVIVERLRSGGDLVKVVDFGLAKVRAPGETAITLPGLVCGTPDYMSPEQGRGEGMDGRGDIYSAGVMLFELLTEQLPYIADTPTNVVLKHIQAPLPDPRETAPERDIPEELVRIVLCALAKDPNERFQTAGEMAAALRALARELREEGTAVACPSCGTRSAAGKRFCAECGAALGSEAGVRATPAAEPRAQVPASLLPPPMGAPFVGREQQLRELEQAATRALDGPTAVAIVGELGVGRTRLAGAFGEAAAERGDLVVAAGPHDSGAPVPYHPIRSLVLELLHAEPSDLPALARNATDPIVAAGFAELAEPVGLRGSDGASRAGAVACALAHALREGLSDEHASRAVLVVDDLDRCDLLSAQTLRLLPRHADDVPVLVLAVVSAGAQAALVPDMLELTLRGLGTQAAQALSRGEPQPLYERDDDRPGLLPLYLEQLRHLGMALGASTTLPTRLADAFAQRMQRLDAGARRLLQAICVLGVACDRIQLARLVSSGDLALLDALERGGFVKVIGDRIEVEHPYLRDLVEASTPAEARKQLHARALALSTEDDAPLEVRARHAYGAGEPMNAMRLLEEMGDLASARGDAATAVLAFRRGLELVRRELLESGDVSLEDAIASISRRLGAALARRGDLMGAEGVLREALELSGPLSLQRAYVLMELGRVLGRRRRGRDAHRMFGQALELATQLEDSVAQAEAYAGVAELRYAESGTEAALEPLATAEALLDAAGGDPLQLARIVVRRAELCAQRSTESGEALARAREVVGLAASPYLEARVHELQSRLARARGEHDEAEAARARAQATAARAGDASGVLRHLTDSMPASMRPPPRMAGAAGSS